MSRPDLKPLASKDSHPCLLATVHVDAMLEALRQAGCFTIERDDEAGTARAWHTATRQEVFAAIAKSAHGPWIIRHHKQLFEGVAQ